MDKNTNFEQLLRDGAADLASAPIVEKSVAVRHQLRKWVFAGAGTTALVGAGATVVLLMASRSAYGFGEVVQSATDAQFRISKTYQRNASDKNGKEELIFETKIGPDKIKTGYLITAEVLTRKAAEAIGGKGSKFTMRLHYAGARMPVMSSEPVNPDWKVGKSYRAYTEMRLTPGRMVSVRPATGVVIISPPPASLSELLPEYSDFTFEGLLKSRKTKVSDAKLVKHGAPFEGGSYDLWSVPSDSGPLKVWVDPKTHLPYGTEYSTKGEFITTTKMAYVASIPDSEFDVPSGHWKIVDLIARRQKFDEGIASGLGSQDVSGIHVTLRGVLVGPNGRIGAFWTGGDRLSFRDWIKVSVWREGKWMPISQGLNYSTAEERYLLSKGSPESKLRFVDGQAMVGSIVAYKGPRLKDGEKLRIEVPVADDTRAHVTHLPNYPAGQYSTSVVGTAVFETTAWTETMGGSMDLWYNPQN